MSLERKDLRLKLDPVDHAGLTVLAEVAGSEISEWAETVLVAEIRRRIGDAIVIAERAGRAGISGSDRESPPVRVVR